MKKRDLAKLAMVGLASCTLIGCKQHDEKKEASKADAPMKEMSENGESMQMTAAEKDFYNKLNEGSKRVYAKMDHEHRMAVHKAAEDGMDANEAVMMVKKDMVEKRVDDVKEKASQGARRLSDRMSQTSRAAVNVRRQ